VYHVQEKGYPMESGSFARMCVYANCVIYGAVVSLLLGGVVTRAQDAFWQSAETRTLRIMYDATSTGVLLLTLLIIVGLLRWKSWSRVWAMAWNISVAFWLVGFRAFGYFVLVGFSASPPAGFEYFDARTVLQWICGVTLVLLTFCYRTRSVKELFGATRRAP